MKCLLVHLDVAFATRVIKMIPLMIHKFTSDMSDHVFHVRLNGGRTGTERFDPAPNGQPRPLHWLSEDKNEPELDGDMSKIRAQHVY